MATYDFETLPLPVLGAAGSTVSLSDILTQDFGADFGGYTDFYVAYLGTNFFTSEDFRYWSGTSGQIAKWFDNGTDIGNTTNWAWQNSEALKINFPNPNLVHVTAEQASTISFQLGNNIGPFAYILVPVAFDANDNPTRFIQYSVMSGFSPAALNPDAAAGTPDPSDVLAAINRLTQLYPDVPNDNDCDYIACAVAAAAGATLTDLSSSLDPTLNQSAGFWRVAYRGSDPNPVTHWSALVQPGDIVRLGWEGGGQHTTTVVSKAATANADGSYNLTVYDNIAFDSHGTEIIGVHADVSGGALYDEQSDSSEVTIFRLTSDHEYLVTGAAAAETLAGSPYNDEIHGLGGNDTIDGGAGVNTSVYRGAHSEYDIRTYHGSDGVLYTHVVDQGGAGDGSDLVSNIQNLQFADGTFHLAGGDLNHLSNVDGGRFDDVLFQSATTGQVLAAQMVGGVFQSWFIDTGALGADWSAAATGNINPGASTAAETFIQNGANGAIVAASHDSGGSVTWTVIAASLADQPDGSSSWHLVAAADVDGNAVVDPIIQSDINGAIEFGAMANGALVGWRPVVGSLATHPDGSSDWKVIGAGDLNGDGFADIVVQDQANGATLYADMNGGTLHGWGIVATNLADQPDGSASLKAVAVGDVDGDGFADVIFQQQGTGLTLYASMKNGALNHWGTVAASIDSSWTVGAVADVDNDGFKDVVFQHAGDGTTIYADMSAAGFAHWGMVTASLGSSDWHVA